MKLITNINQKKNFYFHLIRNDGLFYVHQIAIIHKQNIYSLQRANNETIYICKLKGCKIHNNSKVFIVNLFYF